MSLSPQAARREELAGAAAGQGFQRVRWLRSVELPPAARGNPEVAALGEGLYLLAALSCHREESDDLSRPGDPHALVAPFARRNYYREAVHRLKRVTAGADEPAGSGDASAAGGAGPRLELRAGLRPGLRPGQRIFSNSRLPEKLLAAACGLGFLGSNSLVIAPGLGSAFVIAGVFFPAGTGPASDLRRGSDAPLAGGLEAGGGCGDCRSCLEACPVGAIAAPGAVDPARCLQSLATRLEPWPAAARAAWGFRLYGCQACQDACPHNRALSLQTPTERGVIGPSVPLRGLLGRDEEGVKLLFRGTALDRSWIPAAALLRNGLLAAGHRGDPAVLELVRARRRDPVPAVREAAAWAQESLGRD